MKTNLEATTAALLPLMQSFCRGEYGIALGGAHAKGVDDAESDLDLYVFAREILPGAQRAALCAQVEGVEAVTCWGDDAVFIQGGTDFLYYGKKVEIWFRSIEFISGIIEECQQGIVKREYVAWTVMGFFNYCTLSDISKMHPLEDPAGMLAAWQSEVRVYPELLRKNIIRQYFGAAKFWPDNFHYKTAVARCDSIYTAGIVQQVVFNMIQVIFALNEVYFPGEKKMAAALEHLAIKPVRFVERIQALIFPGVPMDRAVLEEQRRELGSLVSELERLIFAAGIV